MTEMGRLIREHRFERGWRQDELAEKLGTNQTQVSQWETGREDWGAWVIERFFDNLIMIFDYPEDMLSWWVERELTEIEKATSKIHEFKAQAARRGRPASMLTKLDELIGQNRRMHTELAALRDQLKEMI